ncbi:MAG: sigma 54-interacting transcriptional regulator [Acidobacteriaceae bacterium]
MSRWFASPGVMASAERGTVLLDEIGQLTAELQGKLLWVLQEKEIRPAGAAAVTREPSAWICITG